MIKELYDLNEDKTNTATDKICLKILKSTVILS